MAFHRNNNTTKAAAKDDFTYEILEELGTLSTSDKGIEMKLRYISWNGAEPKYDIRLWKLDENGNERCVPKSGRTFTGDEIYELAKILKGMLDEEEEKPKTKAKSVACNARTTSRTTKTSATTTKSEAKAKATVKTARKK